ncbi:uncharacterized protein LOC135682693 [Rhopilema esculentum]|uniref:uncharacterized protein LOC135682693 n=1 Tax=Rhopilema esculentum TaxID=499914 RepID=UPI0031D00DEA
MAGRSGNEVSDDDSSSDEEESARLREAVADSFIFETGKFSSKTTDSSKDFKSKPSLRNSRELDDGTEENGLQVSPEVKIFLSKRLSEFLDSLIGTVEKIPKTFLNKEDSGIRLFRKSQVILNMASLQEASESENWTPKKKRQFSSSSDSEENEAKLREAVVSSDFIVMNAAPLQSSGILSGRKKKKKDNEYSGECISTLGNKHGANDSVCTKTAKKKKKKVKECKESSENADFPDQKRKDKRDFNVNNGQDFDKESGISEKNLAEIGVRREGNKHDLNNLKIKSVESKKIEKFASAKKKKSKKDRHKNDLNIV